MAKVVNMNANDTLISGAATTITIQPLNYGKDWVKTQNTAGTAVLTYMNSPTDAKQTIRYATTPIANVYANTTVDPSYQLPNKRGVSIVAQLNHVVTVTDDSDSEYQVELPIEAHVVMRIPQTSLLSDTQLFYIVKRAISTLIDEQTPANPETYRFSQLIRGAMVPDNL